MTTGNGGARWARRPRRGPARLALAALAALAMLAFAELPAGADLVGTGTHPWVVVLCTFNDQPLDPAPASYFQQMYTDAGAGTGQFNFVDWWHDVSFGQLSVSGTTVADGPHADANGWYTVPETRDTWGSENRYQKVVDCANAASADVNYANYYGVIAIFPEVTATTTAALNSTATTMTLNESSSSPTPSVTTTNYFPTPPFQMSINDGTPNNAETVDVTAESGDTFTIVRGFNGTTAVAHNANASAASDGDFGEVTGGSPVGTPPGQSNVSLATGTFKLATVVLPNETNMDGASHETGHGFGYDHSRKLSYSTNDYNDATDIMSAYSGTYEFTTLGTTFGGSVLGSLPNDKGPGLDAIDLDLQGWIPAPRHYLFNNSVSNQATITLHALSDPSALTSPSGEYLKARSPATVTIEDQSPNQPSGGPTPPTTPPTCTGVGYGCITSDYYTVEYRQQEGWDSGFPASAIVLHLHGATPAPSGSVSYWVDQTPLGHGGLLYAGDEYVDAANNTYVAVNSIDPGSQNAQVTLGSRKIDPQLAYSGDTSGHFNHVSTLAADLTVGGAPVPDEPVVLSVGTQNCLGTTDLSGHASCTITLSQDSGGYTAGASFAGDSAYSATNGGAPFTILREPTQIAYNGALMQDYHDAFTASATLTDEDGGAPIAGKPVTFTLGVGDSCGPVVTDNSGSASCSITPTQKPATLAIVASFAGDADYLPAGTSKPFVISKEETTTAYTGPSVILAGAGGVTLSARLLKDGTVPPVPDGQTLALSVGGQSCNATVGLSGDASCNVTFTGALGPEPIKADFAGDDYYLPSADDTHTAIVFAFPSRGAFLLGDSSVLAAGPATPLTWWGSNWTASNTLSGGPGPPSFKGFLDEIASLPTTTPPASCGGTFTTRPGNSSSPPGSVPAYMGVLVTSQVTKSGSSLAGTFTKIIVVTTDPGYAGDPGHAGTGEIVATFCP